MHRWRERERERETETETERDRERESARAKASERDGQARTGKVRREGSEGSYREMESILLSRFVREETGNGERKGQTGSGKPNVENRKWQSVSGKLEVAIRKWRVELCQWQIRQKQTKSRKCSSGKNSNGKLEMANWK